MWLNMKISQVRVTKTSSKAPLPHTQANQNPYWPPHPQCQPGSPHGDLFCLWLCEKCWPAHVWYVSVPHYLFPSHRYFIYTWPAISQADRWCTCPGNSKVQESEISSGQPSLLCQTSYMLRQAVANIHCFLWTFTSLCWAQCSSIHKTLI